MKQKVSVPFMLLGILFNVCLIAANLLETKVIQVFGITVTAGLLVFPVSYIINDCIAEVWGFRKARLIIWSGFAMNFFVVMLGLIAVALPAAPFWDGAPHFNFVFGMAPRIVAASLTAFLVGSFLNAYVMSRMKVASGGRHFSARAIWSTVVGETADSLIFFPAGSTTALPMQWNAWCKVCVDKPCCYPNCLNTSSIAMSKFMRMIVFFDLPVQTKTERRHATAFRNFLLKDGYHMLQFSVYARVCNGNDAVKKHESRLRASLPPNGSIRLLIVTEKQYQSIQILLGNYQPEEAPFVCEQLSFF